MCASRKDAKTQRWPRPTAEAWGGGAGGATTKRKILLNSRDFEHLHCEERREEDEASKIKSRSKSKRRRRHPPRSCSCSCSCSCSLHPRFLRRGSGHLPPPCCRFFLP